MWPFNQFDCFLGNQGQLLIFSNSFPTVSLFGDHKIELPLLNLVDDGNSLLSCSRRVPFSSSQRDLIAARLLDLLLIS